MARLPVLPLRLAMVLGMLAGVVGGALVGKVADVVLPGSVAVTLGFIVGISLVFATVAALGPPEGLTACVVVFGLFTVLFGAVNSDALGTGLRLAIYLPASALVILAAWATHRYLVPPLTRRRLGPSARKPRRGEPLPERRGPATSQDGAGSGQEAPETFQDVFDSMFGTQGPRREMFDRIFGIKGPQASREALDSLFGTPPRRDRSQD